MKQKDQMRSERLLDILENLQGGVILCNYTPATQTSEMVYINRSWTDITGYTMEQTALTRVGVSFFVRDKLFEPLYAEAAALYRAKSSGKNQCVLANAPPAYKEVPQK